MPSTRRQLLRAAATAGVAGLAGCVADDQPYAAGSDEDADWPMAARDAASTGYSPEASAPRDDAAVRWTAEFQFTPSDRPVVAGDTVLLPTAEGLVAYDAADGTERWRAGEDQPWPASPAVVDDTVYVGLTDERGPALRALSLADGAERWRHDTRGDVRAPPLVDRSSDGDPRALYVGDDTGRVYRFDPASGDPTTHRDVFGAVSSLAVGRALLVGTAAGEVSAFLGRPDRLEALWRRRVQGKVTDLARAGSGIFAATFGGPLYRLQDGAHAGRSRWEVSDGANHVAATPHDVVGVDLAGLSVHRHRTGERRWGLDGTFGAAPAIAGDLLVAGGSTDGDDAGGFVAAYPMRTGVGGGLGGRARWRVETAGPVAEGVAVADGAVFAATEGVDGPGVLYALEAA